MKLWKLASAVLFLLASTNARALIFNPSFEDGFTGWTISPLSNNFGASSTGTYSSTDGDSGVRMWSYTSCLNRGCGGVSFSNGDYRSISQSFDMSSVDSISFDLNLLSASGSNSYQSFIEAAVYIDSTEVWSSQVAGEYLGISISTLLLSGMHTLDFRLQAIGSGSDTTSDHLYLDNVRVSPATVVPAPAAVWLFGSGLIGLVGIARRKERI